MLVTCAMDEPFTLLVNQAAVLAPADGIGRLCPFDRQTRMDLRGHSLASEISECAAVGDHAVDCRGTLSDLVAASTNRGPTKRGRVQGLENCWCV